MTNDDASVALRPRLVVADAARAIDYYERVFGAVEIQRYRDPAGRIVHAELATGDARLTLKDQDATDASRTPSATYGCSPSEPTMGR